MKKFVMAIISIILISGVVQAYNDEATKQLVQLMSDTAHKERGRIKQFGTPEFLGKVKQLITDGADPNARVEWWAPQGAAHQGLHYFDLIGRLIYAGRVEGVDNNLLEDVTKTAFVHGAKTNLTSGWGNEKAFIEGVVYKLDLRIIQLLFDYATPEERAHIATRLEDIIENWKARKQEETIKAQLDRVQTVKRMLDKSMQK